MGKFEIKTDKAGKFRFSLKAGNGQVILASQGYANKAGCENGIESVRKNSQNDAMFERLEAKDGSPYFNLKSSNFGCCMKFKALTTRLHIGLQVKHSAQALIPVSCRLISSQHLIASSPILF